MERLQEAISRARTRREQGSDAAPSERAPHSDTPRQPRPPSDAAGDVWTSITPLTPNERLLKAHRLVAFFGGKQAAAFDMMRTKVLKQTAANGWRRIVITSPGAQSGKTTVTANLAFSLARQTELRVLAIEVDMRRPQMSAILGVKHNVAFARYMSGEDDAFADHMVRYGDNLVFACNTVPAVNSSELLHSSRARERLDNLEQVFQPDIVLFDAPPVMPSDDALAFLDYADCAMIVAAAERTTMNDLDTTEAEVAAATNVLGVVLNKSRYGSGSDVYDDTYY